MSIGLNCDIQDAIESKGCRPPNQKISKNYILVFFVEIRFPLKDFFQTEIIQPIEIFVCVWHIFVSNLFFSRHSSIQTNVQVVGKFRL